MLNPEFAYCYLSVIPVRANHQDESEIVTQLLFGETVIVLEEYNQWRKIRCGHDHYEGWIDFKQIRLISESTFHQLNSSRIRQKELTLTIKTPWGPCNTLIGSKFPDSKSFFSIEGDEFEIIDQKREQQTGDIGTFALKYLNTPYLWGGRSPFGIDCSGFTQCVMHQFGIFLQRDASQQVKEGTEVNFNEQKIGDLAFFINAKGKIHHVGIVLENSKIIHASGRVRIDILDEKGIYKADSKTYSHNFHSIRRFID
jgi:gamma-D-glutamyl-L-lysine dipeptidyl-peptidase